MHLHEGGTRDNVQGCSMDVPPAGIKLYKIPPDPRRAYCQWCSRLPAAYMYPVQESELGVQNQRQQFPMRHRGILLAHPKSYPPTPGDFKLPSELLNVGNDSLQQFVWVSSPSHHLKDTHTQQSRLFYVVWPAVSELL
jgi:hypothetical protein